MAGKGFLFNNGRHLEKLDRRIPAAGNQKFRVGRERHGADPVVHRLLESAVILDEVAPGFRRVFLVAAPVTVMQDFFLSAGKDFPDLDLADVRPARERTHIICWRVSS